MIHKLLVCAVIVGGIASCKTAAALALRPRSPRSQYKEIGEIERLLAEAEVAPDEVWFRGLVSTNEVLDLDKVIKLLEERIRRNQHHRISRFAAARLIRY